MKKKSSIFKKDKNENPEKAKRKIPVKILAIDVGVAVAIAVTVSLFVSPTIVNETSMQPTIDPNDYLLMSKQAYRFGEPKRGDIIVFKSNIKAEDNKHNKMLIKRVIGIPGDIITIVDGNVYRNGEKLEESYIKEGGTNGKIYNLEVPVGEVFVLGDNREVSVDSREIGCVKISKVKGRAFFRLFPFGKMGDVK